MTTTWADTKHRAIQNFNGELPTADTEQTILDAFQTEPLAVLNTLDAVTNDYRAGKARSGWAIWKARIATATTRTNITVDTNDQPRQIKLAETWIRNTGGYLDRLEELDDELFGHRGRLRHWPELKPRIHALWQQERHRCVRTEREAIVRQGRQAQLLKQLRKATRDPSRNAAPPRTRDNPEAAPPRTPPHPIGETSPRPLEGRDDELALVSTPPLDDAYIDSIRPDAEGDPA